MNTPSPAASARLPATPDRATGSSCDTPALLIDFDTYDHLQALAHRCEHLPEVTAGLLQELDRAQLVAPDALPDDAVRVGSRVTYQDEASGAIRTVHLVWPQQADVSAMRISVLTPIGAALIGLRAGQRIRWRLGNDDRRLVVLGVAPD